MFKTRRQPMNKIIIVAVLILLLPVFVSADSIELRPGINEVSIKILNKCDVNFESICVIVKQEDLPEGVFISKNSQHLNVSANSKTEHGLPLLIKVNEEATPGIYEIVFMLKDNANHSWHYKLTAKLEIPKPEKYDLLPNYPNPFNANTQIKYLLVHNQQQQTQLLIYDLLGKQIRILVNKKQSAGTYKVIGDGKDEQGIQAASGIYFYKISTGTFVKVRKMSLIK